MIADIFAIFNSSNPQHHSVDEVAEFNDPQPREPLAHPAARPRPAFARPVYAEVTTFEEVEDEDQEDSHQYDGLVPILAIEPRDPIAHPVTRTRPMLVRS